MTPDTLLYIAPRLPPGAPPLVIDGDLSKAAWAAAPWSSPFQEIRGADAPDGSQPPAACVTRMKMLWDSEYLYVGAELASDFEVRATFTERNSPIFQQDSDFEVFVDAEGSCHAYKELEVNALNTALPKLLLMRQPRGSASSHLVEPAGVEPAAHAALCGRRRRALGPSRPARLERALRGAAADNGNARLARPAQRAGRRRQGGRDGWLKHSVRRRLACGQAPPGPSRSPSATATRSRASQGR